MFRSEPGKIELQQFRKLGERTFDNSLLLKNRLSLMSIMERKKTLFMKNTRKILSNGKILNLKQPKISKTMTKWISICNNTQNYYLP